MEPEKNVLAWSEKVVWQEGMTLDPHHFQQWDRYQASMVHARIRGIAPFSWGLTHIEVDRDRLANGELTLLDCGGVMPDGLPFEISGNLGNVPETRNLAKYAPFTPSTESLNVYLAIPAVRKDGVNVKLQDSNRQSATRYASHTTSVSDDNTGENERPIDVARMNFQLLLEGESLQGFSLLHVAQITRTGDGSYTLAPRFVPTCLYIGASEYLMGLAGRILQNLVTHSSTVSRRATGIFSQRETTPQDVLIFGRLGVVNANIPVVKHYYEEPATHPESLYLALVSLAGQLFSYISSARTAPNAFPSYNHTNLSQSFNKLEEILGELIRDEAPSPIYSNIDLAMLKENVFRADLDKTLLQEGRFFVVARSTQIPEHRLISELPTIARVASPGSIDMVVQAAVPALEIAHTSRLPASVPVDDKASYFELQKRGHFWEAISDESAIAIFMPYNRGQVEIELMAVKRS